MGNKQTIKHKSKCPHHSHQEFNMFIPIHLFKFMEPFDGDSTNGLYFNNFYLPEEIVANILSFVLPNDLLELTLVCKKWCNIVKSETFWMDIYNRRYPSKAKKLPWYVYYCYFATNNFDQNLLKNGNGQNGHEHWIMYNNHWLNIEDPPIEADSLPLDVPEFEGHTSCFAALSNFGQIHQVISFRDKRLLRYILNKFTPHIYASVWVAGKYDGMSSYRLLIKGYYRVSEMQEYDRFAFWEQEDASNTKARIYLKTYLPNIEGGQWQKVQLLAKNYPRHVAELVFEQDGSHVKIAGCAVKIAFDSIQPLEDVVDQNFKMDF